MEIDIHATIRDHYNRKTSEAEWDGICRMMESRLGTFEYLDWLESVFGRFSRRYLDANEAVKDTN